MDGCAVETRQKWISFSIYALSGLTLASALLYVPYEDRSFVSMGLLFLALAFVIPYSRFLLQSATRRQQIVAVGPNCVAALALAVYLWITPFWPPPPEPSFSIFVAGIVVVASTFVVATVAVLLRHKLAYAIGLPTTALLWLTLLQVFLSENTVGRFGAGRLGAVLACFGFAISATSIFLKPKFAYFVGLLACVLSLLNIIDREVSYPYHGNSWLVLNLPTERLYDPELIFARLSILTVAMVVISGIMSVLRLCPAKWQLRGQPIRSRTWPVFPLSLFVVGVWFAESVTPYYLPTELGGISPEVTIVHFEKRGSGSVETRVSVTRDGKLNVSRDVRKPLRYESDGEMFQGVIPSWEKVQPILEFLRSTEFKTQGGVSRDLPHHWTSDTWYVYGSRIPLRVFSSANHSKPPMEVIAFFNDMDNLRRNEGHHFSTRDVCLGFCYEPL